MTTWPARHQASRVSTRQPVTSNAAESRSTVTRTSGVVPSSAESAGPRRPRSSTSAIQGTAHVTFHPLAGGVQHGPHQNSSG